MEHLYNFNDCQTPLEDLNLNQYPDEVRELFFDCINTIPYIKRFIAKDRPRAKDLLRDKDGKIFVDVSLPHIIEDVDYFRPSAIKFLQTGKYTELRPNPNPNSEYGKWIIEEIRRCREGYVRESDGEWVTGDMYFFLNYCLIQLIKKDPNGKTIRTVDFPAFWDGHYYKSHYLNQCREEGKHAAELASRGKGKALPLTTIVPTPSGYKFWGDIEVGDKLWGPDGTEITVTGIPYKGLILLLKIELADGRSIYCSREHEFSITYRGIPKVAEAEWIGYNYHKTRKKGIKNPTGDEYVITLPINNKVEYPHLEVLIDPYTLGLILGDGCLRTPSLLNVIRFTGLIEDVEFYSTLIPYNITDHNSRNIEHSIHKDNIMDDIKNMGLYMTTSHTKFIPEEYKYNTSEVRVAVLLGLVDTDGWINGSTFCYCTSSERLKDDVLEVARSLGIKAYSFKKKNAWTISMQSADYTLCRLPRKIQKIKPITERYRKSCKRVTVTRVSYVNECIGKCVSVDRQDGLYLANDYIVTHNSFYGAAMLAKRFILGESALVNKKVQCVVTASERKYILGANQILDMFLYYIDFNARNTLFPRRRLTSSLLNLQWTMGYLDINTGTRLGTLNSVMGITSKDDESKLRGSRGVLYLLEEAGSFPRLLNLYQVLRPSVEDGDAVWGTIFLYGTSGDSDSDFSSMLELMYNPKGYNIKSIENVYDKEGQGRKEFTYFFPGYINRANCYDENGNSDVTKALLEILNDRYTVKYNSTDINAITKRIAEIPITPLEAILKTKGNIFPVTQLTERLNLIDNNPSEYDDVYCGDLVLDKGGQVKYVPTNQRPIRDFPLKDNTAEGCLEIYQMPESDATGKINPMRYIMGFDPYDNDLANSMSLGSMFVLDLFTDRIVAEFTGRTLYAELLYEKARLLAIFYNCKILYESNIKGTFAYFSKMNCTHLLADTPEYLRDKLLIKYSGFGSSAKGVTATLGVNNYANDLIKEWMIKPVPTIVKEDNEDKEITVPNLYFIRNRALLKEAILYNPIINVDRIRALGMVMLYREERMILFQGDTKNAESDYNDPDYAGNDDFFSVNYDYRFN